MYTLGINAAFHDCAACLIKDGKWIAAAEEERFTQIKHGKRPVPFTAYQLPYHAIDFCLKKAGIVLKDVDNIAYAFDPSLLDKKNGDTTHEAGTHQSSSPYSGWETLFRSYIKQAPQFLADGYPFHLQKRFRETRTDDFVWHFVPHHLAHAVSAYFPSPYDDAAVMVLDGRGEITTTSYYTGENNDITCIGEVAMPHSLGLFYEEVTRYLGFLHSSDEYKVMALASYGEPVYFDFFDALVQIYNDGTYKIHPLELESRFGVARKQEDSFTMFHFNIASSLQKVLEKKVLQLSEWLYEKTKKENLCLAGGVALNCVLNNVLREQSPFKNIWVQPAAGDAGTALGAAIWIDRQLAPNLPGRQRMNKVFWGPAYDDRAIENILQDAKVSYRKAENITEETAALLAENKIIGWFQGAMEFGPRSLGARSILASPLHASMQEKLNRLKEREDFRPVAPVVLEEDAAAWFEHGDPSPFMLFVDRVRKNRMNEIPAVTHVDGTARVQTINRSQHPLYYDLVRSFKKVTGVPILINTSFNIKGKPIVCSPQDALNCFFTSSFDVLVMNCFILEKNFSDEDLEAAFSDQRSIVDLIL